MILEARGGLIFHGPWIMPKVGYLGPRAGFGTRAFEETHMYPKPPKPIYRKNPTP